MASPFKNLLLHTSRMWKLTDFIHWPILIFLFDGVWRWRVGMLNLFYILGPLMHNNMPGLLPGWSRRPVFPRVEMLNLSYCILEALRQNTIPGLGWSKMDSAIHRINRYQPDKYWENQLCYLVEVIQWIALSDFQQLAQGLLPVWTRNNDQFTYPVDSDPIRDQTKE